MPSPAAAGVPAATVFVYPAGLQDVPGGAAGARADARAGAADGQHDPLPQLQDDRPAVRAGPTRCCCCSRCAWSPIATHPRWTLVVLAYAYLLSAFVGMAAQRVFAGGAARGRRTRQLAPPPRSATGSVIVTRRPARALARHLDRAAVQLDVAPRDRQPEPGARRLGGEVGLEERAPAPPRPSRRPCPRPPARTSPRRPLRRAAIRRRPPPGIACSAFSMTLVSARPTSVRSTRSTGSVVGHVHLEVDAVAGAAPGTGRRPRRPGRRARSSARRAVGDEAKLENSDGDLPQQPHLRRGSCRRSSSSTGPSGRPRSACTRRRCSAES